MGVPLLMGFRLVRFFAATTTSQPLDSEAQAQPSSMGDTTPRTDIRISGHSAGHLTYTQTYEMLSSNPVREHLMLVHNLDLVQQLLLNIGRVAFLQRPTGYHTIRALRIS